MRTIPLLLGAACLASLALPRNAPAQDRPPELLLAIDAGDPAQVAALLDGGADPNLTFHDRTPLMFAVWGEQVDIFELLVERGADPWLETGLGTPLLGMAAATGNAEILAHLVELGADLEARDGEGRTALMVAVHNGHPGAAALLVDRGADLDAQESNGWTALMFAAMHGDVASTRLLVDRGADVDLATSDGETPLERARKLEQHPPGPGAEERYRDVVGVLEAAGARGG